MKSFGLKFLVVLVILISAVGAKGVKIFDLKEQYFSETLPKEGKKDFDEFKYDLKNVIVTTDARNVDGSYLLGVFTVDIKEPLKNWNVNIKKSNGIYNAKAMSAIRLTSDSGESYYITFVKGTNQSPAGTTFSNKKLWDYIQINDKKFNICCITGDKFSITVSTKNGKTLFIINGKRFLKADSKNFGNLAKIEIELNKDKYADALYALDIYKVE